MSNFLGQKNKEKAPKPYDFGAFIWQAAPFKITMISPVFSRVSATFGNLFPRWRSVLFNGHCATQKDIAYF